MQSSSLGDRDPFSALLSPLGDRVTQQVAQQAVHQAQTMLGLLRPPPPAIPLASVRGAPPPKVVLGFGLGCDSSAILAHWLTDPSSRDFELHELAVVTGIISSSLPNFASDHRSYVEDMSLIAALMLGNRVGTDRSCQ